MYDFLAVLEEILIFDPIRSDLLRMKFVPSIEEWFNMYDSTRGTTSSNHAWQKGT